jgi:ABC-type transport system substrate-binding protein
MKLRRKVATIALLVAAGAHLLAGCSGATKTPRHPETLHLAVLGSVTLDPARADTADQYRQVALVFEPLVRIDPRTMKPQPGLAERWEASEDQMRFTFTLRDERFHDGSPVTADDVKATLDRVAARTTASPAAPLLASVRGYGETHLNPFPTPLSGVAAPDARTVVVELTRPFADFPVVLANPGLSIVPNAHTATLAVQPVGSGPFRLDARTPTETTLRRVVSPGRVALVERISLVPVAGVDPGLEAVQEGTIDVAPLEESTTTDPPSNATLVQEPSLVIAAFGLNLRNLAFGDERFRRAVLHALNREHLNKDAYGDAARVADGIIPTGVPGARRGACGEICKSDTAGAARLAREVFPNGNFPVLVIDFPDVEASRRVAQRAQVQLAEVGIPTSLRPHAPLIYQSFLEMGEAQLFVLPDVEAVPTAAIDLDPRFLSGARENVVGVTSPPVDQALAAARADLDGRARAEKYATAARAVIDQAAVLPIAQFNHRVARGGRARGVQLDRFGALNPLQLRVAGEGSGGADG